MRMGLSFFSVLRVNDLPTSYSEIIFMLLRRVSTAYGERELTRMRLGVDSQMSKQLSSRIQSPAAKSTKKPSFILRTEDLTSVVIQLRLAAESEVFSAAGIKQIYLMTIAAYPLGASQFLFAFSDQVELSRSLLVNLRERVTFNLKFFFISCVRGRVISRRRNDV